MFLECPYCKQPLHYYSEYANAEVKAETKNGYKDFKAFTTFSVKKGFLPKLGSTEFIIKKSKKIKRDIKFKLEDILNIDLKNMKALSSDLNGCFWFDNSMIKDAKITAKQQHFSLFLEGDYNIDNEYADFQVFGKYNESVEKKIKVLFVPLSWIVNIVFKPEHTYEQYKNKLKCVPDTSAKSEEEKSFRVKINGNMNNSDKKSGNNLQVEMKRIL